MDIDLGLDGLVIEAHGLELLPPGRKPQFIEVEHATLHALSDVIQAASQDADRRVTLSIEFTDAGGLRWHRAGNDGILRRVIDGKVIANSASDVTAKVGTPAPGPLGRVGNEPPIGGTSMSAA